MDRIVNGNTFRSLVNTLQKSPKSAETEPYWPYPFPEEEMIARYGLIRSAPICFAERTPSKPTAPSPTTTTVLPGPASAASAANQPVPRTSEVASRLGTRTLPGNSGVATSVPSASGTRRKGAYAPVAAPGCRLMQKV